MSMSDTTEIAALAAFLQGTDPAYRSGATQYLALFEGDPGESASLAQESNYTDYARVKIKSKNSHQNKRRTAHEH